MLHTQDQWEAQKFSQNAAFPHNGTSPHVASPVSSQSIEMFPNSWPEGYRSAGWPVKPPNLTALDSFLSRFVRNQVYQTSLSNLMHFNQEHRLQFGHAVKKFLTTFWINVRNQLHGVFSRIVWPYRTPVTFIKKCLKWALVQYKLMRCRKMRCTSIYVLSDFVWIYVSVYSSWN